MSGQALNPYLPEWEYVPDGEPHVFGDRVYVYGSHDAFGAPMFCVKDYVCWSAPVDDLSAWRCEGTIYRRSQDPANRLGLRLLFAPDVARGADGRYYLFYAFDFMGTIGVAVCDEPAGSYEFYAHVSWPDGTPYGRRDGDGFGFDPAVLVDDDGRVWLYSGFATPVPVLVTGGHPCRFEGGYVVELERDMRTVRGPQRLLFPKQGPGSFAGHEFFEASSIRHYDDTYYFVYSSRHNHELCYATSGRPDGDFVWQGTLVSIGDVGLPGHPDEARADNYLGNTHGGLLRLGERTYVFYHRQTDRCSYARQACAEELRRGADGRLLQAEVTSCGLNGGPLAGQGTYGARIACNLWSRDGVGRVDGAFPRLRLAAHPYLTQEGADGDVSARQYVANLRDGAVVGFKYFDLAGLSRLEVMARGRGRGRLVVSFDAEGRDVAGVMALAPASRSWQRHGCAVVAGAAKSALYLRYEGTGAWELLELTLG